jgi:monoamine oxidase
VVIVGGGISGLTAAYRLVRGTALSVLVLEANDRVGGRTENLPLPGSPGKITEGGGQWTGPGQDRVQALARELGITTFKTFTDGESVYLYKGRRRTFTGVIPPIGPAALADLAQAQIRLERMASTVPL